MMNAAFPLLRRARVIAGLATALILVNSASLQAQQAGGGFSTNEFYRQGDQFSDRFANFMRGIFGSGAPRSSSRFSQPSYQQPAPPSYTPPPTTVAPQPAASRSRSAPARTVKPKTTASTSARSGSAGKTIARASSSGKTTKSAGSSSQRVTVPVEGTGTRSGVYTSTKQSSSASRVVTAPEPAITRSSDLPPPLPAAGSASKPSVSTPPPAGAGTSSPSTVASTTPARTEAPAPARTTTTPAPQTTPSKTVAASSQTFPVGSNGSKPGRVVSPYEPHNELDVRGLPSGSLALDPTTQKIFRVP